MADSFSKRHGFRGAATPIKVREDAPEFLRASVLSLAGKAGLDAATLRALICDRLRVLPDRDNWSDGNVWFECEAHLRDCDWFRVYDIAEDIFEYLATAAKKHAGPSDAASSFSGALNEEFVEDGIGWQMVGGKIKTRGEEGFETTVRTAAASLAERGWPLAASEIGKALRALSARPEVDKTGAIQHSMAALECVAREVAGDKQTLGDLMKRYREKLGIPPPLDSAVEKAWGYASQAGRHLSEGKEPGRDEAELVVGLCAALCTYLSRRPIPIPF